MYSGHADMMHLTTNHGVKRRKREAYFLNLYFSFSPAGCFSSKQVISALNIDNVSSFSRCINISVSIHALLKYA